MCNNLKLVSAEANKIDVNLEDIILTPLTCATLVSEIMKCLVYQKSQIPYPYNWLKSAVRKKRSNEQAVNARAFSIIKNFQEASKALDTMEDIMENIKNVLENVDCQLKEILLIFGSTPITPKEIFSIQIPNIARGHNEINHKNLVQKNQHSILRKILLSDVWLKATDIFLPSTNLYVFIKTTNGIDPPGDFFNSNYVFTCPDNIPKTDICVRYDEGSDSCCENLRIFEDGSLMDQSTSSGSTNETNSSVDGEEKWFQTRLFLKGFKDCFVNKVSASQLW